MPFLSSTVEETRGSLPTTDVEFCADMVYGSRFASIDIPRFSMPDTGCPANIAKKMIRDDLALDGNPLLNLASYVTTYMEDEAEELMFENMSKNFIDLEQYPQTADLSARCLNIIARLFHAPTSQMDDQQQAIGCSAVGSSEAIMLATLAMKRRWQHRRRAAGLSTDKPNIVMGSHVQICWEKAVCYFELDTKFVYFDKGTMTINPQRAVDLVDENTVGVVGILGDTYTGRYDDIEKINELLDKKCKETGLDVPIHVDAASGGFIAPFIHQDVKWDFRLSRVVSINVSGHKYGLTYAGIGWAVWRGPEYLPNDLVFNINYLGAQQATFTLNFSKNAMNVIGQYYVLIRMGRDGFTALMNNLQNIARTLTTAIKETGEFEIISEQEKPALPVVAFRLKVNEDRQFTEFDLSMKLREHGWIVPAYTFDLSEPQDKPKNPITIVRCVVREDFSMSRCHLFIRDLTKAVKQLKDIEKSSLEHRMSQVKVTSEHALKSSSSKWDFVATALRNAKGVAAKHGIC